MDRIKKHFGYFSTDGPTPEHDPGNTCPCLICYKPWNEETVMTVSLMVPGDNRSYFYRVHKACYEALTEQEKITYDSSLIDRVRL